VYLFQIYKNDMLFLTVDHVDLKFFSKNSESKRNM